MEMWIRVCCKRIRRNVFFQGNNLCYKACLGSGCTAYRYFDRKGSRLGRGVPLCPDNLGAACRDDNIIYRVCASINLEGNTCRIIGIYLCGAADGNAGNHIRIHTIGVIGSLQLCFRYIRIAYNTDSQSGQNLCIGNLTGCGSGPCRVP